MMKRIALVLLSLVLTVGALNAQNSKRTSAYMYNKNGKLDKAKTAIDDAILHEKTKEDAKTWFYRGLIYLKIATTDKEKYKALDNNAILEAYNSFQKAVKFDKDKDYKNEIAMGLLQTAEVFFNKGVDLYNKKEWVPASENFERAFVVNQSFGKVDTASLRNVSLTLTFAIQKATDDAQKANLEKKVIRAYQQLLGLKVKDPNVYSEFANIMIKSGDFDQALKIIQRGRQIDPSNYNLIVSEANIYLKTKETKKAIDVLNKAIELDPNNGTVYAAVANMYSEVARDTTLGKEEQLVAFTEAEKNFKKAIEIDGDSFDNYFNLGALFYNKGADILAVANELAFDDPTYPELEKEAQENLKASLPFLEKARELKADDVWVLRSLKEVYARTKQYDKMKEVNEKLKELEK
ncbi:MAG: tetratricopeptide repeat protein [Bacteroidales bacterium]